MVSLRKKERRCSFFHVRSVSQSEASAKRSEMPGSSPDRNSTLPVTSHASSLGCRTGRTQLARSITQHFRRKDYRGRSGAGGGAGGTPKGRRAGAGTISVVIAVPGGRFRSKTFV